MCPSAEISRPRPTILLKKRRWHNCFPVNFTKFLITLLHIFYGTPSSDCFCLQLRLNMTKVTRTFLKLHLSLHDVHRKSLINDYTIFVISSVLEPCKTSKMEHFTKIFFSHNAPSQMFDKVLDVSLLCVIMIKLYRINSHQVKDTMKAYFCYRHNTLLQGTTLSRLFYLF